MPSFKGRVEICNHSLVVVMIIGMLHDAMTVWGETLSNKR